MVSYTFNRSALTKTETWAVSQTGLDYTNDGEVHFNCLFNHIASIRLKYSPTRIKTNNFSCEIGFSNDQVSKVKIPSTSYVSFGSFDDQAEAYARFVKQLCLEVAKANPTCKFYTGKKMSALLLEYAAVIFMITFFIWIFTQLSVQLNEFIAVKIIVVIWSLYYVVIGFTRNKPGNFDPNNVPDKVLPAVPITS